MMFMDRDVCAVLSDMEKCCDTLNFAPLRGLLVEAKILSSRVESLADMDYSVELRRRLEQLREWSAMHNKIRACRSELKDLLATVEDKTLFPSLSKILKEED